MTAKKSTKTGKNFRGVGGNFSGWPEYISLIDTLGAWDWVADAAPG